jgi:hypothetical protein
MLVVGWIAGVICGFTGGVGWMYHLRRSSAQEAVQKAREHDSWHSVRAYNLNHIVRMAYNDIACGHYHFYRGQLGIDGEARKEVCIMAAKELIKMGVWDADSMRRLSENLDERISEVG